MNPFLQGAIAAAGFLFAAGLVWLTAALVWAFVAEMFTSPRRMRVSAFTGRYPQQRRRWEG